MSLNKYMHPRNPYKMRKPDFKQLAIKYDYFREKATQNESGKVVIDFKDPGCLRALTRALLEEDFGLNVSLPLDRLIPTVPQRLNYILWLEDIVGQSSDVKGIDIGTGSSCIYSLLGCKRNDWRFLASEVDDQNVFFAQKNVAQNQMKDKITIQSVSEDTLLQGLLDGTTERYDFSMCNPPFYSDHLEAQGITNSRNDDRAEPCSISTAGESEGVAWGGEVRFVSQMIQESLTLQTQVRVYTSLLGKKNSLQPLKDLLAKCKVPKFATTEFCQGRTMRWGLAWSFDQTVQFPKSTFKEQKKGKAELVHEIARDSGGVTDYTVQAYTWMLRKHVEDLQIPYYTVHSGKFYTCLVLQAQTNTWSHQRRKRRERRRKLSGADNTGTDVVMETCTGNSGKETGDCGKETVNNGEKKVDCVKEKGDCGKEQEDCGKEQGDCGKEQGDCGKEREDCGKEQGDCGKEQGDCGKEQGDCGKEREDCGKEQGDCGKEREDCGKEREDCGKEQGDCGKGREYHGADGEKTLKKDLCPGEVNKYGDYNNEEKGSEIIISNKLASGQYVNTGESTRNCDKDAEISVHREDSKLSENGKETVIDVQHDETKGTCDKLNVLDNENEKFIRKREIENVDGDCVVVNKKVKLTDAEEEVKEMPVSSGERKMMSVEEVAETWKHHSSVGGEIEGSSGAGREKSGNCNSETEGKPSIGTSVPGVSSEKCNVSSANKDGMVTDDSNTLCREKVVAQFWKEQEENMKSGHKERKQHSFLEKLEPFSDTEECLLRCKMVIRKEEGKMSLTLTHMAGNRECLHQVMQYFRNVLK